jgi:CheY-like chemotaxis protein
MARILVIDDDELIRDMLSQVIQQAGHRVLLAENGRVGLGVLEQSPVDLVVLDIFMPDMEGFETMRAIRERHDNIKIIAISGGARDIDHTIFLEDAELLGADASLPKPFPNSALTGLIENLIH